MARAGLGTVRTTLVYTLAANVSSAFEGNSTVSHSTAPALSALDNAIVQALDTFTAPEFAANVSKITVQVKAWKAASKGVQAGLFAGFVSLAESGANGDVIRATGNMIRAAVTRVMRVDAGFPADKVKGSKESQAPTFSTASAYASLVGKLLDSRHANPTMYAVALQGAIDETEIPATLSANGLMFEGVSACKRLQAQYDALQLADNQRLYPALYPQSPMSLERQHAIQGVELLELQKINAAMAQELGDLRAQVAHLLEQSKAVAAA
jgi:hypothetical protein